LPVVLYGCETWSLIFRDKYRLGVFEKCGEEDIGPKRDKVTVEWKRLNNEEFHDLYYL